MTAAPSEASVMFCGSVTSNVTPMIRPTKVNGVRYRSSRHFAWRRSRTPTDDEAARSSTTMTGSTNCTGHRCVSTGIATRPEPKPDRPNTKYAAAIIAAATRNSLGSTGKRGALATAQRDARARSSLKSSREDPGGFAQTMLR